MTEEPTEESTIIDEPDAIEETIEIELPTPPVIDKLEESIKFAIKAAEEQENAIVREELPIIQSSPEPVIDKLEESIKRTVEAAEAEQPKENLVIEEQIQEEPEIKTPVDIAEEKLDIGKPLEFGKQETHSFAEWLKISKLTPINREEEPKSQEQEEGISKKMELIDKFIETNPKIAPVKNTPVSPVNTERFSPDNSSLMTETLARVYLEQKKYSKAIQAYEILILKYPEKSVFFADHISDIKILQQNNN
jgi:tetratricopeptide (TPR) repeat protein